MDDIKELIDDIKNPKVSGISKFRDLDAMVKDYFSDGIITDKELMTLDRIDALLTNEFRVAQEHIAKMDKKSPSYGAAQELLNYMYRCRNLIDKCPIYQAYLNEANIIKERYEDMLLYGRYNDVLGFENSNKKVTAHAFVAQDGKRMAIVAANQLREEQSLKCEITVPGFRYVEHSTLGNAKVANGGKRLTLGQYDLAVLLFEKE